MAKTLTHLTLSQIKWFLSLTLIFRFIMLLTYSKSLPDFSTTYLQVFVTGEKSTKYYCLLLMNQKYVAETLSKFLGNVTNQNILKNLF